MANKPKPRDRVQDAIEKVRSAIHEQVKDLSVGDYRAFLDELEADVVGWDSAWHEENPDED